MRIFSDEAHSRLLSRNHFVSVAMATMNAIVYMLFDYECYTLDKRCLMQMLMY